MDDKADAFKVDPPIKIDREKIDSSFKIFVMPKTRISKEGKPFIISRNGSVLGGK